MSENVTEVIAGGAVLAAAVGFLLFAAQGTGLAASRGTYDLTASFQSAEGITVVGRRVPLGQRRWRPTPDDLIPVASRRPAG